MKHIAYLGAGLSGRSQNVRAISSATRAELQWGVPHDGDEVIASVSVASAHGPLTLLAAPGIVFEDAARRAIARAADAIVFVTDGRPERLDATVEAWDCIDALLGGKARPPIVIQHNHRDAPDATPIEVLEKALGVQRFFVGGELRMPNPVAVLYPYRVEAVAARGVGVSETLELAARAAYEGIPKPDPRSADFAMAMLDKQIADKLKAMAPSVEPALARDALKGEGGRDAFLEAAAPAWKDAFMAMLAGDESLQDEVARQVEARAASSVIHEVKCPRCGLVEPSFEIAFASPDAKGPFFVGSPLPVDPSRIAPTEYLTATPYRGGAMLVIDGNQCIECDEIAWLGLSIDGGTLQGVWPVALTRATLGRAHYTTAGVALEAGRLAGRDPRSLHPSEVLPLLWDCLPS